MVLAEDQDFNLDKGAEPQGAIPQLQVTFSRGWRSLAPSALENMLPRPPAPERALTAQVNPEPACGKLMKK